MTSMFDYDDSVNLAYNAKIAGKNLIAAKHELLNKTGEFLFLAHSDREFALRCQMIEQDIEGVAYRRLASLSDSKAKLVRAAFDEWQLRHASCGMCKTATPLDYQEPSATSEFDASGTLQITREPGRSTSTGTCNDCKKPVGPLFTPTSGPFREAPNVSGGGVSWTGVAPHPETGVLTNLESLTKEDLQKMPKGSPALCKSCATERAVKLTSKQANPVAGEPCNYPGCGNVALAAPANKMCIDHGGPAQVGGQLKHINLAPVVRDEKPQVASRDMHHDACKPTGCHPECRIQLPPKGVQSQINL